jgi:hypothetical protein
MSWTSLSVRRCSANIRSRAASIAVGEARFRTGARPAHRQVQGDAPRFEPEIAGLADALDEVDGLDLAGLGEQDPEPRRPIRARWSAARRSG